MLLGGLFQTFVGHLVANRSGFRPALAEPRSATRGLEPGPGARVAANACWCRGLGASVASEARKSPLESGVQASRGTSQALRSRPELPAHGWPANQSAGLGLCRRMTLLRLSCCCIVPSFPPSQGSLSVSSLDIVGYFLFSFSSLPFHAV